MAIPLSAIRKYTPEIIALSFVAIVLGAFWSIIDTYQPLHLLDLRQNLTHLNNTHDVAAAAANLTAANLTAPPTTIAPIEVDLRGAFDEEDGNGKEISISTPASAAINTTTDEIDDGFALGAPKVIKFALTGEFDTFVFAHFNKSINSIIFLFFAFVLPVAQPLPFLPFLYCGMLKKLSTTVATRTF